MLFISKLMKKARAIGTNAMLYYGPVLTWGYGFQSVWKGPREPGVKDTELTLRTVKRRELDGATELQMRFEIVQHYDSGANTRYAIGSMTLHGDALEQFRKLVNMDETPEAEEYEKGATHG